jgi:hypothetical protein
VEEFLFTVRTFVLKAHIAQWQSACLAMCKFWEQKKKKEEGEKVKKDRRRKRSSFVLSLYMKFP